jgi:hypothetical protein
MFASHLCLPQNGQRYSWLKKLRLDHIVIDEKSSKSPKKFVMFTQKTATRSYWRNVKIAEKIRVVNQKTANQAENIIITLFYKKLTHNYWRRDAWNSDHNIDPRNALSVIVVVFSQLSHARTVCLFLMREYLSIYFQKFSNIAHARSQSYDTANSRYRFRE